MEKNSFISITQEQAFNHLCNICGEKGHIMKFSILYRDWYVHDHYYKGEYRGFGTSDDMKMIHDICPKCFVKEVLRVEQKLLDNGK